MMKKGICAVLSLLLVCGCGSKSDKTSENGSVISNLNRPEKTETTVDHEEPQAENSAEEAFTAFLNGEARVHASGSTAFETEAFGGIAAGDYTEEELRWAVKDLLGAAVQLRYAYVYPDLSKDALLVLNYGDLLDQWLQRYVVLSYTENGLEISLEFEGIYTLPFSIDENGLLYTTADYGECSAETSVVQMRSDGSFYETARHYWLTGRDLNVLLEDVSEGRAVNKPDLEGDYQFFVNALRKNGEMQFSVMQYSMDDQQRANEEQLVDELKKCGAIEMSSLDQLFDEDPVSPVWIYEDGFVLSEYSKWREDFSFQGNAYDYVSMREVEQGTYGDICFELAEGPYTRTVELTFPQDIMSLNIYNVTDVEWSQDGNNVVYGDLVEHLNEVRAGSTVILEIQIDEYRPSTAIQITIPGGIGGYDLFYYIEESGLDGSLSLQQYEPY